MSKKTYNVLIVVVTLITGVTLSFMSFSLMRRHEYEKIENEFYALVNDRVERFQREVNNNIDLLYSVAGFFATSSKVTRIEFKSFINYISPAQFDILSVDWAPRVSDTEKQLFEESVRKEGFPDYYITEIDSEGCITKSSQYKEYYPIYYTEPFEKNKIIFGLDIASESVRREAIESAIRKGKPVSSGWIKLAKEYGEKYGCRIFMPVYKKDDTSGTVKEGSQDIEGLASILFKMTSIAELSWGKLVPRGLDAYIFDKRDMKGEKCICFHDQKKRLRSLTGKDINIKNGLWKEEEIKVADNKWSMIFTPSPEFYTIYRAGFRRIWIVLVFSLIVSVLVALYLEELLSHTAKVEEEVKNKTYELNESNKMLYEANDKLKKLDKIKSDFVSNVSHEVKNPLSIIKMSVDSILDGDSGEIDERQKGPLGMIRRNVERLLRLVTDILDISKIEAGEMKLKIEQVDVASLVSEIIHDYEIEIKQKQFTVRTDFQNDLGLVQADKDKLSEVIINLLNNAIKYTPSGGNILIKLASDENGIRFEISDNGQGIAKENLEKIFDKFERVTAEKQEGTGLGLPIARDIILLHKGKLWVESELGKGSKFIFTLPYKMTS